jgi:hypothetical protein
MTYILLLLRFQEMGRFESCLRGRFISVTTRHVRFSGRKGYCQMYPSPNATPWFLSSFKSSF